MPRRAPRLICGTRETSFTCAPHAPPRGTMSTVRGGALKSPCGVPDFPVSVAFFSLPRAPLVPLPLGVPVEAPVPLRLRIPPPPSRADCVPWHRRTLFSRCSFRSPVGSLNVVGLTLLLRIGSSHELTRPRVILGSGHVDPSIGGGGVGGARTARFFASRTNSCGASEAQARRAAGGWVKVVGDSRVGAEEIGGRFEVG